MPELSQLLAFAGASVLVLVSPGPAILFLVARSIQGGRGVGVVSAVGLTAGASVHAVASVVGLSALMAASVTVFTTIKLAGAAYLIYLGVRAWRGGDDAAPGEQEEARSTLRHFLDGFLVNIFNPKISLFFIAFLPQFVRPEAGSVKAQLLVFSAVFMVLVLAVDIIYALAAGTLRPWLAGNLRMRRAQRRFSALTYVGLGVAAAFAGRER